MHTRLKRAPKKLEPIRQRKEKGKKDKKKVGCTLYCFLNNASEALCTHGFSKSKFRSKFL